MFFFLRRTEEYRSDIGRRDLIELEALEPRVLLNGAPVGSLPSIEIDAHLLRADELAALEALVGVASEGSNANVIVNGHGTGLRAPTEAEWQSLVGQVQIVDGLRLLGGPGLPPALDWSTSIYFPPIGNQDGEGSCTCWAVAYYTKTFQEAMEHGWDLSTVSWVGGYSGQPDSQLDHIFSPDFIYHQIDYGGDYGSAAVVAGDVIGEIGAATWSTMPFDPLHPTSWPSLAAWLEAPIYRGDGPMYVMDVSSSVNALKALLASGNLAQIAIDAADMYEVATLDNFHNNDINHANTIVGYDDNFAYTEGGVTRYGAFKVANSWGPTWAGEGNADGCWWLSYRALRYRIGEVTFMEDRTGYNPELIAVFGINHLDRGETTITFGAGKLTDPLITKYFISPQNSSDGNDPFPSNLMALDLTEFQGSYSLPCSFFMEVTDGGLVRTGTVTSFSVTEYSDYINDVVVRTSSSSEPPVDTVQGGTIYVQTLLCNPVLGVDLMPYGAGFGVSLYGFSGGDLSYTLINTGRSAANGFSVDFYISDDNALGGGDDCLIATATVSHMDGLSYLDASLYVSDFPPVDPFGTDGDYYLLVSVDPHNDVSESNEGNNVEADAINWTWGSVFFDDFSTDRGWTGYGFRQWERGPAVAGGAGSYGYADPAYDTTPGADNYVLGYYIGGDYPAGIPSIQWITSPVLDCRNFQDVTLEFQRWLNVRSSSYDYVHIQAYDGTVWQTVFHNSWSSGIQDSAWQFEQIDVSAQADGNDRFQIRFGLGPTTARASGWNIDDVRVVGTAASGAAPTQVAGISVSPVIAAPLYDIEVDFTKLMAVYSLADAANYELMNNDTGVPVPITAEPAVDNVVLDIAGGPLLGGDYTLTLAGDGIKDCWGNYLDGDGNGTEGGDYVYTFQVKWLGLEAGTIDAYGGRVTFYDTTPGIGPDEIDVRAVATVKGNATVGITEVDLKPQYSEFGVVIEQAPWSARPVAVYDQTLGTVPISFIVADCDISVLSLKSPLTGLDLNGLSVGSGIALGADIDGDGQTDDAVGLVVLGDAGQIRSTARIAGDVAVAGDVSLVDARGSYGVIAGEVHVNGNLGQLRSAASLSGEVYAGGSITTVSLSRMLAGSGLYAGGNMRVIQVSGAMAGDIAAGGSVNSFIASGDMTGTLASGGNLGQVTIRGNLIDSTLTVGGSLSTLAVQRNLVGTDIEVGGLLSTVSVGGRYTDSSIDAGMLSKVSVKGLITSALPPNDFIHADLGRFALYMGGARYNVFDSAGVWINGVHASVG
jgi:hypothetical protein